METWGRQVAGAQTDMRTTAEAQPRAGPHAMSCHCQQAVQATDWMDGRQQPAMLKVQRKRCGQAFCHPSVPACAPHRVTVLSACCLSTGRTVWPQ